MAVDNSVRLADEDVACVSTSLPARGAVVGHAWKYHKVCINVPSSRVRLGNLVHESLPPSYSSGFALSYLVVARLYTHVLTTLRVVLLLLSITLKHYLLFHHYAHLWHYWTQFLDIHLIEETLDRYALNTRYTSTSISCSLIKAQYEDIAQDAFSARSDLPAFCIYMRRTIRWTPWLATSSRRQC